jgi:hypothetical protein
VQEPLSASTEDVRVLSREELFNELIEVELALNKLRNGCSADYARLSAKKRSLLQRLYRKGIFQDE